MTDRRPDGQILNIKLNREQSVKSLAKESNTETERYTYRS